LHNPESCFPSGISLFLGSWRPSCDDYEGRVLRLTCIDHPSCYAL
jgi:hypothetical protein